MNGNKTGYAKTAGKLVEIAVKKSGRFVVKDQPVWVLDLITKFTSGKHIV